MNPVLVLPQKEVLPSLAEKRALHALASRDALKNAASNLGRPS